MKYLYDHSYIKVSSELSGAPNTVYTIFRAIEYRFYVEIVHETCYEITRINCQIFRSLPLFSSLMFVWSLYSTQLKV